MKRRDLLRGTTVAAAAGGLGAPSAASAESPAPRLKVDIHTHHYPEAFFQAIRDAKGSDFSFAQDPTGRTIIRYRGARFFGIQPAMTDIQKRLADMDRVGIDMGVLSLSTPNVFFTEAAGQPAVARMVNDAYAKVVADHPRRFMGFASIPMDAPDEALRELDRALSVLKLHGVVLLSNLRGRALTSPVYRPFFEEANRRKVAILLHPMLPPNPEGMQEYVLGPIVGFPFDTSLAVARMCYDGLFRDFPDIRFVICHAGGAIPWLMERLDNGYRDFAETKAKISELPSTYLKRLHYDTVTFSPYVLRMLRDLVGSERMLMGSDYPHLLGSIDRAVTSIEGLGLPSEEQARILGGNALRILGNVTAGS